MFRGAPRETNLNRDACASECAFNVCVRVYIDGVMLHSGYTWPVRYALPGQLPPPMLRWWSLAMPMLLLLLPLLLPPLPLMMTVVVVVVSVETFNVDKLLSALAILAAAAVVEFAAIDSDALMRSARAVRRPAQKCERCVCGGHV